MVISKLAVRILPCDDMFIACMAWFIFYLATISMSQGRTDNLSQGRIRARVLLTGTARTFYLSKIMHAWLRAAWQMQKNTSEFLTHGLRGK